MSNVKFKYLYRDAGNCKNYGFWVFGDIDDLPINEASERLETAFINGIHFIAEQIGVPELFHDDYPTIDDISFHEYDGLELTEDVGPFSEQTIREFVEKVEKESAVGWKIFDPRERLSHY